MIEILKYYLTRCHQATIHQTELCFEFGDYNITFTFQLHEKYDADDEFTEANYRYFGIKELSEIDELVAKITQFTSCKIRGYEYLGWRDDSIEVRSLTYEMYELIKKVNSYRKDSVKDFFTNVEYGDAMCDTDGNYTFTVEVTQDLWWDLEFAKYVLTFLYSTDDFIVPTFYSTFFHKRTVLKDSKVVAVVSSNTKVRRIGYFKVLALFFNDFKKVASRSINKKFENYSLKYKEIILNSQFTKGVISETPSGISAKPYIDVATELHIVNKLNNMFIASKSFKVYQTLQLNLSDTENVFELSQFDKLFFLECILKSDYFYFTNLLELIYLSEQTTYSELLSKYQTQLIKCLDEYKRINLFENRKVLQGIDVILNRITKWEKPEIYLEHIIMPRLNWMLDFEVIKETKQNNFQITEVGKKLFRNLAIWNDINHTKLISPNAFLDRFIVHMYDECYNEKKINNPPDSSILLNKLYGYIEESFSLFKTLAPNRVTASQAANYAKYKLYFVDNIKVGYQFILNKLSEQDQNAFIYKYQEQYQDGYIQLKN